MARLLAIRCPECDAGLKLPETRSSRKITCPKCQHTFAAPNTPPRDDVPTSESPTGTIALADTTAELPASQAPMLRRQHSAEEQSEGGGGGNPLQALMSRMGDNALLYVLGGALAVMMVVYFSLFLSGSNNTVDGAADLNGSRSTTTGASNSNVSTTTASATQSSGTTPGATTGTNARPSKTQTGATKLDPQKLDLAWLPPEAELILSVRPSELWGSPALTGSFTDGTWQSFAQLLADEFKLATTDFERVTVGITGWPAGTTPEALSAGLLARMLPRTDMIVTAHFQKPVAPESLGLEKQGFSLTPHRDRRYYRGPDSSDGENLCLLFADKTRIVLGRESSLRAAIERNGQAARRPELDFADANAAFVVVGVPRALAQWVLPGAGTMEGAFSRFQQVLASQARGVSLSLSLKGTASIDLGIDCRDLPAASTMRQVFEQLLIERRQRTAPWPTAVNTHLADLFDRLSGNLKVESQGSSIHARGALPKLPETTLAELTSWISPLDARSADASDEIDIANLPAGSPRTPVTMLGVPGGIQMQSHVRWGAAPPSQGAARPALRLQLVLDLKGGPAASGIARSACPVGAINTDRGDRLNWRDDAFQKISGNDMLRIARTGGSDQPGDGVRIVLSADRPTQLPGTISQFEGSVTLVSGRDVKLVSIRNLRDYIGKTLPHPELKGCGLTFKVERNGNRLVVKAKGRDTRTAGPGPAIDGKGQVLPAVNVEFVDSESELQFILPAGDDLPRDAGLQIAVCNSVKEHVIPFRFERLDVPPAPKRNSTKPSTSIAGAPGNGSSRPAATQSASGQVTVIEPAALMQAFIDDASASKKRFLLQRLELTGVVTEVKQKGNLREIFLQIPQTGKSVTCDGFRDATLIDGKIMAGDMVTIRGSFLGLGNSDFVSLSQCDLVGK